MSQAPVEGGKSSTAYLTGASHLNKRANARSARDVEHCYADQSKPNETERGLRVVGGALYSFALNQNWTAGLCYRLRCPQSCSAAPTLASMYRDGLRRTCPTTVRTRIGH